jgi:hypothetical protein
MPVLCRIAQTYCVGEAFLKTVIWGRVESLGGDVFGEELFPFREFDGFGAGVVFGLEDLRDPEGCEGEAGFFEESFHHGEDVVLNFVRETEVGKYGRGMGMRCRYAVGCRSVGWGSLWHD